MFEVNQLAVGGFDQNFSYVVHDTESGECLVIDPCGNTEMIRTARNSTAAMNGTRG